MRQQQYANKSNKKHSTTIALTAIVVLFLLFSCNEDKKTIVVDNGESDSIAFMSTYGVNTLISDSGRISYKVEAEEWLMYDKRNPSYWAFEKGIYLEQYDDSMNVETTLRSDTAYYYDKLGLWQLFGNVRVHTIKDERIFTDKLFWSSETERIYSDSYIRIEQKDQVTEGIGFTSNQNLTVWEILNTTGIYPIEDIK